MQATKGGLFKDVLSTDVVVDTVSLLHVVVISIFQVFVASECTMFKGFIQGLYTVCKVMEFKSHFPGLESLGIRPRSWKVMEMQIAGVTDFLMISANHIRYLVEFVTNICSTFPFVYIRYKMTIICTAFHNSVPRR